jgi:hypothetical protein
VPEETGANPFHDWNEKIYQTCYLPNLDIGNFSKISFNIGPTLIRWLREKHPEALERIVEADQEALKQTGHGNAIAQSFHHIILPLATVTEKHQEIQWGIQDFFLTFGRVPEGMWLPETAVDIETLSLLADKGIKFTILAPWQVESENGTNGPYKIELPAGRSIVVFTYSTEVSSRASFDEIATSNADLFAANYVFPRYTSNDDDQVVTMATDGELFGHHQAFRDLFLKHLVNGSLKSAGITLMNPANYLGDHPYLPVALIKENTSWSCHHGIKRWQEECGCTPGASWKKPLRLCMNLIAQDIDSACLGFCKPLGIELYHSMESYAQVLSRRVSITGWMNSWINPQISENKRIKIALLFTAQEYRYKMFTSCGWFFSEFDRIEPRNCITNAAYAIFLVEKALGISIAQNHAKLLSSIESEDQMVNGETIFNQAYSRFQREKSVNQIFHLV